MTTNRQRRQRYPHDFVLSNHYLELGDFLSFLVYAWVQLSCLKNISSQILN